MKALTLNAKPRAVSHSLLAALVIGCIYAFCTESAYANNSTYVKNRTFAKSNVTPINVQAALIKNFTHLIKWPESHRRDNSTTFNICIYNSSSLAKQFRDIFTGKVIKGKKANIININSEDLSQCDLAYVVPSSGESFEPILKSAGESGVLTVSSEKGYGKMGVHINFFESGDNVAFELNKNTLDSAGFQVSTQLFRYAKIVQ
ncbi:YfiR family protein [Alkalimarinus coralli]|uniref:YfiR family protein n=1 Tax=Alkalimarinus coralli TaxID=2935863 RepID=UPI00202AEB2E|nr:YfiR family protein [Alkalimarinus coralli]